MTFARPCRREARLRKAILRGIYEENLRMAGGRRSEKGIGKALLLRKIALALFVALAAVFGSSSLLDLSVVQEDHINLAGSLVNTLTDGAETTDADGGINPSYYSAFLRDDGTPLSELFGLKVRTIIIDPGHGGEDPGAVGRLGTKEKDITLAIARMLKERLSRYDNYQILLTRDDDRTLSLNRRTEIANSLKADLFISIHVNYLPNKPINIIETYYFGAHSDDATLRLAEQENKGSQFSLGDFKEMIRKIGNTMKLQESKMLALSIQESLFRNMEELHGNVFDYGIKTAPFVVLLGVDVPSVLTEVSCLSNPEEEKKLATVEYRREIARFLEEGIVAYLNKQKGVTGYETARLQH